MTTCRRSGSNLLSPPNRPVYQPRDGQCPFDQNSQVCRHTEGPLREPLGTVVYRHCWFRRTQLEHAGFSAGQRVFFLLWKVRICKSRISVMQKLTCNSDRPHANAIFPECLLAALYDRHDSENSGVDQVEVQFPRSIGRDRFRIEPDK